ncbi:hypothetical protein CUJ83_03365 [Methanocella sp. CWC-04]|uniref:Oxidoreductase molybdopterin binding domain-containing protein n=1 Tax=Methanooceanicella nereidis TaxID=2052831 RepID=A0AAP2RAY5_9EURY|nr:hypothetical protein [Methanocella sp. CWC-04]MCD1294033.1 hypothetical protein [Methanocella sp. CWC-04]
MRKNQLFAITIIGLMLLAITAVSGCTSTGTGEDSGLKSGLADNSDFKIEVTGGTTSPVTVTWSDILNMEFVEVKGVTMINSVGTEKTSDYVGVPMMDIINKAGCPDGEVSFKVAAPDGYNKVYTRAQMEKSILGLKENSTALTNNINKNSIKMVVPGEPGDMWMKLPVKIDIVAGSLSNVNDKEPVVLNITGKVENTKSFRLSDLKANPMKTMTVPYKDDTTLTVTGTYFNKLLEEAKPAADAAEIKLIAEDGYSKTIALSNVIACEDALIAFNDDGTLQSIFPGESFGTWVKQLVTIEVL